MPETKKGVTIGVSAEKQEETIKVENREFTEEETTNQLRLNEEDFLQGLVEAAEYKDDEEQTANIEIVRPDRKTGAKKVLFAFRVRALSEGEYDKCKKKHTRYVRNKALGVKMPENTDSVKYRAAIIYEATIPEDRKKLWDNKDAWEALRSKGKQIMSGLDLIEECLKAGEKDGIIDVIDHLSGYNDNLEEVKELEETIKN